MINLFIFIVILFVPSVYNYTEGYRIKIKLICWLTNIEIKHWSWYPQYKSSQLWLVFQIVPCWLIYTMTAKLINLQCSLYCNKELNNINHSKNKYLKRDIVVWGIHKILLDIKSNCGPFKCKDLCFILLFIVIPALSGLTNMRNQRGIKLIRRSWDQCLIPWLTTKDSLIDYKQHWKSY